MSTATQATDLLAAWERYNASLEALIESADGEYQEQRRFSAFEAGWRDGGNASVDATLRDTLVLAAGKRIDDLERERDALQQRVASLEGAIRGVGDRGVCWCPDSWAGRNAEDHCSPCAAVRAALAAAAQGGISDSGGFERLGE